MAARLATEAGELLLALRIDLINAGVPRWQVMDEGDAVAHHFLAKALADARPDDAILSEEGRDSPNRLAHNRVWIVDPLDGTNEYGEDGRRRVGGARRPGDRRHRRRPAAVALPVLGTTLATEPAADAGAGPQPGPPRIVTSRWHPPRPPR